MKKLLSQLQQPEMKLDDRFTLKNVTPEILPEVVDVFAEGYFQSNPIFVALNYTKQDIKQFISLNFPDPIKLANFLPSIIVVDTQKDNKIVAVLHQNDFFVKSQYPQKITKGMEFKQYIDYRLFTPLDPKYKQPGVSAVTSYSSIPEYQNFKLGNTMYNFLVYFEYVAGYKNSVNLLYNIYSKKVMFKFDDQTLVNQINIQNEFLDGKQIFKDQKALCAVSCYRLLQESTFQNENIFTQSFKRPITCSNH